MEFISAQTLKAIGFPQAESAHITNLLRNSNIVSKSKPETVRTVRNGVAMESTRWTSHWSRDDVIAAMRQAIELKRAHHQLFMRALDILTAR